MRADSFDDSQFGEQPNYGNGRLRVTFTRPVTISCGATVPEEPSEASRVSRSVFMLFAGVYSVPQNVVLTTSLHNAFIL